MLVWRLLLVSVVIISCLVAQSKTASIMDLLEWSLSGKGAEVRAEEDEDTTGGQRNCLCDGPSCICCVDFNLTFVDLGGPGCVRMKYIPEEEGFAVNVSYGNSILRSQVLKGPDPEPTCINLLSRVAQLCARLTELAPTSDGLRGCLQLEPTLLGESQLDFPLGCFRSGPNGMAMEAVKYNVTQVESSGSSEINPTNLNAAQIIQVVNESAEEGIAFFSNLLGLTFGGGNSTESSEEETTTSKPETSSVASSRNSKMMQGKGPNMI